ncbi:class I SAM-dependent methyltransferase [Miniimonas arenae]|uniref:class I SAM-dependent methyltransferase n=1 Tax=Miniimonas arenae TaxID=676201 RepID=UPI0028B265A1|nr:methyltransferase [Miniimonas arenae]
MTGDHYFTAAPASEQERRTIDVHLAGRDLRLTTASGVFSADHLDSATRILLGAVPPPPPEGVLVDLGCGWGPLALALALAAPGARVLAVDVNERALELTRTNAAAVGATNVTALRPEDVEPDVRVDALWSNPPIRIGKAALHDLLRRWLPRLADDGVAHLVVAKQLGADSLARWLVETLGAPVERVTSQGGFRVLRVGRPTTA